MHAQDDLLEGVEVRISFRPGIRVGHVAKPLSSDGSNHKFDTLKVKSFIWIGIKAIAALMRLGTGKRRGHQLRVG